MLCKHEVEIAKQNKGRIFGGLGCKDSLPDIIYIYIYIMFL